MNNITKDQLINAISERTGITKKDIASVLETFVDEIISQLQAGNKINIAGFGTFQVKDRAARNGINPQTKEKLTIPATKVPKFTPGKTLKDAVK